MSSRKFRFVSPGVFLREIDNSQLPAQADAVGPVIIGRTNKGPALKPYKIRSLEELETVFGKPSPGSSLDPWREGAGLLADTHALHAAKAYLTAGQGTDSPVTIIRLLGVADDQATPNTDGEPGWQTDAAYGVFLVEETAAARDANGQIDLELAAIFYGAGTFQPKLEGHDITADDNTAAGGVDHNPVRFTDNDKLRITLHNDGSTRATRSLFKDLRRDLNTNPVLTNSRISEIMAGTLSEAYWLGETFEESFKKFEETIAGDSKKAAVVLKLASGNGEMSDFRSGDHGAFAARTGWVVSQDTTEDQSSFDIDNQSKLFRIVALHEGQQASQELLIGIEDIQVPRDGALNPYGSFSVVVRKVVATGLVELERFSNCNLDASSPDFIARQIGDQILEWDNSEKRNKVYGEHPNASEYIRVEMHNSIKNGLQNTAHVPFGFYGPVRPADITGTLAVAGAAAAEATITVETNQADIIGDSIISVTDADGTVVEFIFKVDVNTVDGSENPGGKPIIGVLAETGGSGLDSADANTRQTAANAVAGKIKTVIDAVSAAKSLGVTVTVNNNIVTITQTATGTAGNSGQTGALTKQADTANKFSLVDFAGGNDGSLNPSPEIDSWVADTLNLANMGVVGTDYNISWPSMPVVNVSSVSTDYTFGVSPVKMSYSSTGVATVGTSIDPGYIDFLRRMPTYDSSVLAADQERGVATSGKTKYSFKFSLDEVILKPVATSTVGELSGQGDVSEAVYTPGSFTGATSGTDRSYAGDVTAGTAGCSLRRLLNIVGGFQMPLDGGFDGVNITESDPFNEEALSANSLQTSYAYASVDRAIELIKDPEAIEHNLAVMPGISNRSLTRKLIQKCEARADSMAIIDLPEIYVPPSERKKDTFKLRLTTTPEDAANDLVAEQLNSSYGATYYPWVKIKDVDHNRDVWAPPSVVALGVMANTERSSEVWFAPAGFNRGGLNSGNAGVPVLQVTEQLLSKDRDTLYQANINPIASFVSEGIVIFGQKTLQSTASALDRINVRRLLIHVKKEVSRISRNLLFEQNVQATWARFHGQVKPFLESVKARFGLSDFKVVLDSTTTTADLIDRNIMYAKVFLKPARAIEFIAVDFVITRSGASFSDPLE